MREQAKLELSKDEMLAYFGEINQRLATAGKHGEIMLLGGATLTLVFIARHSTRDIDAFYRPAEDMRIIIKDMASEYNLEEDWLNDGAKGFITTAMKFEQYLTYSNLTVSNIDAEGLLAMKLTAARDASKDMADSIFLMNMLNIRTEEQLFDIVKKYTHPTMHTPKARFFTAEAFEQYRQGYQKNLAEVEQAPPRTLC